MAKEITEESKREYIRQNIELASIFEEKGSYIRAVLHQDAALTEALPLAESTGKADDRYALALVWGSLGALCRNIESPYEAKSLTEKCISTLQELYTETREELYRNARSRLIDELLSGQSSSPDITAYRKEYVSYKNGADSLGRYDILVNDDNEVLLAMNRTLGGEVDNPVFYYDGGDNAVLFKNDNSFVICDKPHPDVRKIIMANDSLLICEKEDVDNAYMIPVVRTGLAGDLASRLLG